MDVGEVPPPITPAHNPHDVPVRPQICLVGSCLAHEATHLEPC